MIRMQMFNVFLLITNGFFNAVPVRAGDDRIPVILITDVGVEIDDQWTVVYLLANPRFETLGIISTHAPFLVPPAAHSSFEVLRDVVENRLGMEEHPPLFEGSNLPLAKDMDPQLNAGVEFLLETSKRFSSDHRLTVLTIGAMTELASAILADGTIVSRIRVVSMAMKAWPQGGYEFNAANDVQAVQVVLASDVPLTIGTGDVAAASLGLTLEEANGMLKDCGPLGRWLWSDFQIFYNRVVDLLLGGDYSKPWVIWDNIVLAHLLGMTTSETSPRPRLNDDLSFMHVDTDRVVTWITDVDQEKLWVDFLQNLTAFQLTHEVGDDLSPSFRHKPEAIKELSDSGKPDTDNLPSKQEILARVLEGTWAMTVDQMPLVVLMHIQASGKMTMDWTFDGVSWCRDEDMEVDVIDILSDRDFKIVPVWTANTCGVPAGATAEYHFAFEKASPLTYKVPDGKLANGMPFTGSVQKCSNQWDDENGCGYTPGLDRRTRKQDSFQKHTIHVGNTKRTYELYIPTTYKGTPSPLFIGLHGYSLANMESFTNLSSKAEKEGFVLAYPSGEEPVNTIPYWNSGTCCPRPSTDRNDVTFIDEMMKDIFNKVSIDKARIFLAGLSNGGNMAYRLACELPEAFTALASVTGILEVDCPTSKSVSFLHIHGTSDFVAKYNGGPTNLHPTISVPGAPKSVELLALSKNCDSTPILTFSNGDTSCITYQNCDDHTEVTLCTVKDGSHTWQMSKDNDITDMVWDFFLDSSK